LNERLAVVEEAVSLMGQHISMAEGIALDMPLLADSAASEERIKQFEAIHNKAWNLVGIIGSDELRKKYTRLVTIYWRTREGSLDDDYAEVNETQKTIYKILDDMRSRA